MWSSVLFFVSAFVIVAAGMPLLCRWALASGFVDQPGGRKQHEGAVPPVGGLLVFPVFMILSAIAFGLAGHMSVEIGSLFAALMLLLVTGAWDDRYGVAPRVKFLVQFVAAFILVFPAGAVLDNLGPLFGENKFWLGFMAYPFAVIASVLLINAVNLMDGLDGLAGGTGFIILAGLTVSALLHGGHDLLPMVLILMGALAGFLFYNMRTPWRTKAQVFLGDAGSLALGAVLAWFSFHLADDRAGSAARVIEPISVAWLLALPIYDICGQFARRMREGRHPFDADAHHFHHHFLHAGATPGRATALILCLGLLCAGIGVGGVAIGVPVPVLTYGWIAALLAHIYLSLDPARMQRLIGLCLRTRSE